MDDRTLYQYGTLALMVPGLFKGTKKLSDILKHGDTGIGTADSLDGELIVLNGQGYQVKGNGQINKLSGNEMVPFADVNFANFKKLFDAKNINKQRLSDEIFSHKPYHNIFFAVKIHGVFQNIHTRSVKKAQPPYPTLVQMADRQATFQANHKTGTLIGYYSPQIFNGPSVGGFHLHFLADDLSIGGHVLDFNLDHGQIDIQPLPKLNQELPADNHDFMRHDFSKDNISGAINHAEN